VLSLADLAGYEARLVDPLVMEFRGFTLLSAPPPANGASLFLPIMKALEADDFGAGPLRTAARIDRIGRVWRVVEPQERRLIADSPDARRNFQALISPDSIRAIRNQAAGPETSARAAFREDGPDYESPMAATTQWMVTDAEGNIACCTQSQSLHFGAGVIPPAPAW
jgi:gamma-glutamyltranspeptidase/glutathione hydrolase